MIWILFSVSQSPFQDRQAGDFHTDSDTVLGFFQTLVRQLSREETIEVIETKGAMVSSDTIWNEVQVTRTAGWVFHPILLQRRRSHRMLTELTHGRTLPSLSEELYDGSDVIRVTFWQTAGLPPRGSLGERSHCYDTSDTFRVFCVRGVT